MVAEKHAFPLPTDLPVPTDDGACAHLTGTLIPSILLPSTAGNTVDLSKLDGLTVVFFYPRTGAPGASIPASWDAIPGARGCTPHACGFRDLSKDLLAAGVNHLFGFSTQDTAYQQEVKERLHLPYQLLSDEKFECVRAMRLPTFEFEGTELVKRLAIAVLDGKIVKVWYPIFPSDRNASDVLLWLQNEWAGASST
jgi:peroxiredoxin